MTPRQSRKQPARKKRKPMKAWAVWSDVSNCICSRGYCEPYELYFRRMDARHRIKRIGLSRMRAVRVKIVLEN